MYQCAVTADEIDTCGVCRSIQRLCKSNRILALAGSGNQSDWCNGDSLVDNRNTVLLADILAGLHQIACIAANLIIDFITSLVDVRIHAVKQGNTHRDGTDVQILVFDHIDRF